MKTYEKEKAASITYAQYYTRFKGAFPNKLKVLCIFAKFKGFLSACSMTLDYVDMAAKGDCVPELNQKCDCLDDYPTITGSVFAQSVFKKFSRCHNHGIFQTGFQKIFITGK